MVQKVLVNKSAFARLAGVSAAAIGKACKHDLAPAFGSGKIDKNHPAAVAYLERRSVATMAPEATGMDPRHSEAVKWCATNRTYSKAGLQRGIKISYKRAQKIIGMMAIAGLIPEPGQSVEITKPTPAPIQVVEGQVRPISGQEKSRMTKKQDRPPEQYDPDEMLLQIPEDIRKLADWSLRDLVTKFGTDVAFLDFLKATKQLEDIHEKRLKNAKSSGELVDREQIKIGVIEPINTAHVKLLTDGSKTIAVRTKAMLDAGRDLGEVEKFITEQISSFIKPMKARVARGLKNA